jgi:ATP-dependent RNA helicase MSS116
LLATRASPPPETVAMPVLTEAVPETTMRFADLAPLGCLEPQLLRTITDDLGYDHMMPVQEATLSELLGRKIDCLAQAKTGTGKTVSGRWCRRAD